MQPLTRDEVRRHIAADPRTIYDLVSDVPRTPEWSREVAACQWLEGATGPTVGALFKATNKRKWATWSNKPVVVVADPGREFSISRTEWIGGTMVWRYRLEPDATGTTVIQSYEVTKRVPMALLWACRLFLGQQDEEADLNENMRASLEKVAALAEREQQQRNTSSTPARADQAL